MAKRYANKGKDSSVRKYTPKPTAIQVEFSDKSKYEYTKDSAGTRRINTMKKLAQEGEGLNEYINKRASDKYESKE